MSRFSQLRQIPLHLVQTAQHLPDFLLELVHFPKALMDAALGKPVGDDVVEGNIQEALEPTNIQGVAHR